MYRLGHTGIALLVLAPLAYVLGEAHKPLLALITALGVLAIEPLPDLDFKLPFLDHRGVSHSVFAAVCIGGFLALCGWFATDQLAPALASVFTTVSGAVTSGATALQSVTPSGATGRFADLFRTIADGFTWIGSQLQGLDRQLVAEYGFAIGTGGILVHLLGDVITVSGIRPLLPISSRRVSLSSLRANSTLGNTGLFAGGVIAIAIVLSLTVGGAGIAMPADLSPIGAAHAQDAAVGTQNDPMQINSTTANQTGAQTASQNQTQNASSATATVEFANQTANGSTVAIRRATLPEGGFVVLSNDPYEEIGLLEESMIAVSQPLSPGTHRNITVNISHSPPGGYQNQTTLNTTSDYSVGLYRDSNNNSRFEYVTSAGTNDSAYEVGFGTQRRLASDAASITVPGSDTPTPNASVRFTDQSVTDSTVTVRSVTLPEGGFVVVHNESYLRSGSDPTQTAIGLSGYLSAGTHRNVSVTLTNGSAQQDQTLIAIPSRDTNNSKTYDYVRSDGFQDVPYTAGGEVVTARASVSISGGPSPTAAMSMAASTDSSQPTAEAASSEGDNSGRFSVNPLIVGAGIVFALVIIGVIAFSRRS